MRIHIYPCQMELDQSIVHWVTCSEHFRSLAPVKVWLIFNYLLLTPTSTVLVQGPLLICKQSIKMSHQSMRTMAQHDYCQITGTFKGMK